MIMEMGVPQIIQWPLCFEYGLAFGFLHLVRVFLPDVAFPFTVGSWHDSCCVLSGSSRRSNLILNNRHGRRENRIQDLAGSERENNRI